MDSRGIRPKRLPNAERHAPRPGKLSSKTLGIQAAIWIATFGIVEVALRVIDLRVLRDGQSERTIAYRHDHGTSAGPPVPNSEFIVTPAPERRIHAKHNSFGLRDIEPWRIGKAENPVHRSDSFVWGERRRGGCSASPSGCGKAAGATTSSMPGAPGYGTEPRNFWLKRLRDLHPSPRSWC